MRHRLLSIAENAAREAGDYLRRSFASQKHEVRFKAHHEPVSEADLESGRIIARNLSLASASLPIISEEEVGEEEVFIPPDAWILDPLDGTRNFLSGIPIFAVAIALVEDGAPTLAVIYDPVHDEMYAAQAGEGATLNRRPLRVSGRTIEEPGILLAGSGRGADARSRHSAIIQAIEHKTPYFRRLGSAAVMLASVAGGRADAVILTGNKKPWDMVAGALLVKESGGRVTDFCGDAWISTGQDMVATNGQVHNYLLSTISGLKEAGCDL